MSSWTWARKENDGGTLGRWAWLVVVLDEGYRAGPKNQGSADCCLISFHVLGSEERRALGSLGRGVVQMMTILLVSLEMGVVQYVMQHAWQSFDQQCYTVDIPYLMNMMQKRQHLTVTQHHAH